MSISLSPTVPYHPKNQNWTFCFDKEQYFAITDKDGTDVNVMVWNPVSDLFRDTDVEFDNEDILAVIMDCEFERLALMTKSWILKFDLSLFEGVVVHHGSWDWERGIGLTQKKQIPLHLHSRHKNCLFKECKPNERAAVQS